MAAARDRLAASRAAPLADTERRCLYVFSPLAPQRNGLADYLAEYLSSLSRDFKLVLVAESGTAEQAAVAHLHRPGIEVIDEVEFLARQPDASAQVLYNLGNNVDCAYALDYIHAFPGAVILHDVSLFYLHQVAAQRAQCNSLLGQWLVDEGVTLPQDFMARDGSLARTPGLVYQECLMLARVAASAKAVMVHTHYAERRLRGAAPGVAFSTQERPLVCIPHFVLEPAQVPERVRNEVWSRFGIEDGDFLMLVPGFLSGNKLLYEVLACFRALQSRCPGARLLFAGEERSEEYPLSQRIGQLWPQGGGPGITGYLEAVELDALLSRADLSFVLRFPTYGESSGILPRAAMGGGRVLTVDIGAYPEFASPHVWPVEVGSGIVDRLERGAWRAIEARRADTGDARRKRQEAERSRLASLAPEALYPALKSWLDEAWQVSA